MAYHLPCQAAADGVADLQWQRPVVGGRPAARAVTRENARPAMGRTPAVERLEALNTAAPGYCDVSDRLATAYSRFGDQLSSETEWCQAMAQYVQSLQLENSQTVKTKMEPAQDYCLAPERTATPETLGTGTPEASAPSTIARLPGSATLYFAMRDGNSAGIYALTAASGDSLRAPSLQDQVHQRTATPAVDLLDDLGHLFVAQSQHVLPQVERRALRVPLEGRDRHDAVGQRHPAMRPDQPRPLRQARVTSGKDRCRTNEAVDVHPPTSVGCGSRPHQLAMGELGTGERSLVSQRMILLHDHIPDVGVHVLQLQARRDGRRYAVCVMDQRQVSCSDRDAVHGLHGVLLINRQDEIRVALQRAP